METPPNPGTVTTGSCPRCTELEKKIRHLRQDVARRIRDVRRTGQLTSLAEEVFQAIPVGLLVCQFQPPGELFCVSANGETGRLTGIDTDKFRGVEFDEIWPDARRQGLTEALLRTVQRGEPLSSYLAYYRKGGVERTFEMCACPLGNNRVCLKFHDATSQQCTRLVSLATQERPKGRGGDPNAELGSGTIEPGQETARPKSQPQQSPPLTRERSGTRKRKTF